MVRALVGGRVGGATLDALHAALASKDATALAHAASALPERQRRALHDLLTLYGGADVIEEARRLLPGEATIVAALDDLGRLASHARAAHPDVAVGFDLADVGGYAYYTGARFAVYAEGSSDAIARGGRYDEVGAIFGRNRPAVGFGLDVKDLAMLSPTPPARAPIVAPRNDDAALRDAVRELRGRGEVVVAALDEGADAAGAPNPGARRLVESGGRWTVAQR